MINLIPPQYLIGGLLIVSAGAAFTGWAYLDQRDESVRLALELKQKEAIVEQLGAQFRAQVQRLNQAQEEMLLIRLERDKIANQLESYKRREHVVQTKPKAVERLANDATERVFNDIYRATCRRCDPEATRPDPRHTGQD